jgi:hypothetical protein
MILGRLINLRKNCYGQVIVSPRILKKKAVLFLILQQKLGLFKSAAPNLGVFFLLLEYFELSHEV